MAGPGLTCAVNLLFCLLQGTVASRQRLHRPFFAPSPQGTQSLHRIDGCHDNSVRMAETVLSISLGSSGA